MTTLDSWEGWCADINTNPDPEFYQPALTQKGSTRPFRPLPVVIARPATVAERPVREGDFLAGFAYGFALALPLFFAMTVVALFLAGR